MTLDEAIKHAEEVERQNEEDAVIYANCKNHKKNLYEIGLAENAEKKCCKCAEEHRQLAEWLKELKRLREQTRWIPCSKKLPEPNRSVLVQLNDDFVDPIQIMTLDISKCEGDFFYFWRTQETGINFDMDDVVAWQPMPKLWEGRQE